VDKGFERSDAYSRVMQDWEGFAESGFIDLLVPMNYKREARPDQAADHRGWARFLGQTASRAGRIGINGVDGEDLNSLDDILTQIGATRNLPGVSGIATYCYAQCRKGSKMIPDTEFFSAIRARAFPQPASIPEAPWLSRPREGLVKGVVSRGRKPLDGATVQLDGQSALTDGSGFYAFARVAPGSHRLTVEQGGATLGAQSVEARAGEVVEAPIAIP
jgi:hypothetical protein